MARLESLDVLRVVATLAVVTIHTSAATLLSTPPEALGYAVAGFLNQAGRFALPAFVLISGAGLFHAYGQRQDFSWRQYLIRRFALLGVPYIAWSLVYFFFFRILERDFGALVPRLLNALLTASAVYTFYYFIIIVPFYLLFPLVRPLGRSRWLGPVALAALAATGLFYWLSFPEAKFGLDSLLGGLWRYRGRTPLWWMGFFFLGAWLGTRWASAIVWLRRRWVALSVLAVPLLVWVQLEFQSFVRLGRLDDVATNFRPSAYAYGLAVIPAIIGLGAVVCERSALVVKTVLTLSRYCFGIYLIHPLVMYLTRAVLEPLSIGALTYFLLNTALVLVLSYLGVLVIARLPLGGWVLGLRG